MSLKAGEDIGEEVHLTNDQFFRFESGSGKCIIDGNEYSLRDGVAIVVPAGAQHNVINTSETEELKLYTIYSPAHHKDQIVRATKEEAEADGPEFDGHQVDFDLLADRLGTYRTQEQEAIARCEGACKVGLKP